MNTVHLGATLVKMPRNFVHFPKNRIFLANLSKNSHFEKISDFLGNGQNFLGIFSSVIRHTNVLRTNYYYLLWWGFADPKTGYTLRFISYQMTVASSPILLFGKNIDKQWIWKWKMENSRNKVKVHWIDWGLVWRKSSIFSCQNYNI